MNSFSANTLAHFLNCKLDFYLLGPVRTCLLLCTSLLVIPHNSNNFDNFNRGSKWDEWRQNPILENKFHRLFCCCIWSKRSHGRPPMHNILKYVSFNYVKQVITLIFKISRRLDNFAVQLRLHDGLCRCHIQPWRGSLIFIFVNNLNSVEERTCSLTFAYKIHSTTTGIAHS
jgi:hypothetical protein